MQIRTSLLNSLTACTISRKKIVRLATTVDPSTKALHDIEQSEREQMWADLLTEMRQEQKLQPSSAPNISVLQSAPAAAATADDDFFDDLDWDSTTFPASSVSAAASSSGATESVEEELRRWRLETGLQFTDSANALQWWTRSDDERKQPNWQRFPTISKIARRILCIPATSAPRHVLCHMYSLCSSERIFSKMGVVVDKRHCSMIPARVGARVFLRENLWHVIPPPRREASSPYKQSAAVKVALQQQLQQQ